MKDLIKALQIFAKYTDTKWPTHCEHDILYVGVHPDGVSSEDTKELAKLSFHPDDGGYFTSTRFGSY